MSRPIESCNRIAHTNRPQLVDEGDCICHLQTTVDV